MRVNREPGTAWGFRVARPRLAIGRRGSVHVFHASQVAVSRDRGRGLSAPTGLPAPARPANYPVIATRDGGAQLAWQQGDAIVTHYIGGADPLLR